MIQRIEVQGFHDRTFMLDLAPRNLVCAPNGAGKSTIAQAAQLALLGYVPGNDKRADAVMDGCPARTMALSVTIDGHRVERRYMRRADDSVQARVNVDNIDVAANASAGVIKMALKGEPPIIDLPAVWALSPKERAKWMLDFAGVGADLLQREQTARDNKNTAIGDARGVEKALSSLTSQQATIAPGTADAEKLKADRIEIGRQLEELLSELAHGQERDDQRKDLQAKIAQRSDIEKRLADEKAKCAKAEDDLIDLKKDAQRLRDSLKMCRGYAAGELVIQQLGGIAGEHPDADDDIQNLLKSIRESSERFAVDEEKLAYVEQSIADGAKAIPAYANAIGKLHRWMDEIRRAERDLAKLPEGVSADLKGRIAGLRDRADKLDVQITAATRSNTFLRQVEESRLRLEDAKKRAQTAIDAHAAVAEQLFSLWNSVQVDTPIGRILLQIDPDGAREYLLRGDRVIPRTHLSGGERVLYDAWYALLLANRRKDGKPITVFIEAGEVDARTMSETLPMLDAPEFGPHQIVILRWARLMDVPTNWQVFVNDPKTVFATA